MKRPLKFSQLTPAGKRRRVLDTVKAVFNTALTAVCYITAGAAVWLVLVAFLSVEL